MSSIHEAFSRDAPPQTLITYTFFPPEYIARTHPSLLSWEDFQPGKIPILRAATSGGITYDRNTHSVVARVLIAPVNIHPCLAPAAGADDIISPLPDGLSHDKAMITVTAHKGGVNAFHYLEGDRPDLRHMTEATFALMVSLGRRIGHTAIELSRDGQVLSDINPVKGQSVGSYDPTGDIEIECCWK